MDKVIKTLLVSLFISHFDGNPAVFNPYHSYSSDEHAERIYFLFENTTAACRATSKLTPGTRAFVSGPDLPFQEAIVKTRAYRVTGAGVA